MAATAGGIRAGLAFIEVGLKDSALKKGLDATAARLKSLGSTINSVGAGLGAAGAAITVPFIAAAKTYADAGAALSIMSQRTGFSVESLSALGYAASQTETDMADVELGVKKMQKALLAAAEGNAEAASTFMVLGLSVEKLMKMSPEQKFQRIAQAVNAVQNDTMRAGFAMQIFGKGGTHLLPMIANMDELTAESQKLGLVMSTESAKGAEALHLALLTLGKVAGSITKAIGSALAPELTGLVEVFTNVVIAVRDFVKEHKQLTLAAFGVGAALVAMGTAIVTFGTVLFFSGTILSTMAAIISGIDTAIGLLISPIAIVAANMVGLAGIFLTSTQAGGKALSWLGGMFSNLMGNVSSTFEGISNALLAGNISLAVKILWSAIKLEWYKGTAFISSIIPAWMSSIIGFFQDLYTRISGYVASGWLWIKSEWIKGVSYVNSILAPWVSYVTGFFQEVATDAPGFMSDTWIVIKQVWTEAIGYLGSLLDTWYPYVVGIFQSVYSTVTELATSAWTLIKSAWTTGLSYVNSIIGPWASYVTGIFQKVAADAPGFMIDAWAAIKTGFVESVAYMQNMWTSFVTSLQTTWNSFAGFFLKVWEVIKSGWAMGVSFITSVWNAVSPALIATWNVFSGFFLGVWSVLQKVFEAGIGVLLMAWNGFVWAAQATWNLFGAAFAKVWAWIKSKFTGGDLDKEIARIDAETKAKNDKLETEKTKTETDRKAAADKTAEDIEKQRKKSQEALDQERKQREWESDWDDSDEDEESASPSDLENAYDEFNRLAVEAADEADKKRRSKEGKGDKAATPFTPDELDNTMADTKRKIDVGGSFSGTALAGLTAGSSVQDDQLKEQKKMNSNLTKIHDDINKKEDAFAS